MSLIKNHTSSTINAPHLQHVKLECVRPNNKLQTRGSTVEVYSSKYLHIAFFAEQLLLEATWLSETKMMDSDECEQEFLNYLDVVRKQRPLKIIVDSSNLFFTFDPKMQDWINEAILHPLLTMHIYRLAFVISKDFFAQLATKQTMDEKEGLKFTTKYFDTKDAAKKWILSSS